MDTVIEQLPTTFLVTFFTEKDLPEVTWELTDDAGDTHFISNTVVLEALVTAPAHEVAKIENIIRQIDIRNGDVNHFLQHLAGALINR